MDSRLISTDNIYVVGIDGIAVYGTYVLELWEVVPANEQVRAVDLLPGEPQFIASAFKAVE